jgi:O-succinylbenzoate synthase
VTRVTRPDDPQRVTLRRVRLPLVAPLRSAHGTESVRDLVLVEVVSADGTSGWGECSALARPTYTAEHVAGAWAVLRDELVPALLAGNESGVVGHPMAAAAVSGAVRDGALRRRGRSLVDHVAASLGRPRAAVPTTAVIGRLPIDDLVRRVEAEIGRGASLVKLKVTPRRDDLEGVTAVRRTWPDLALAVDGNGTLDARALQVLDELRLVYVEQPAPAEDLLGSVELARRGDTPIALDESITSVDALRTAAALGAGHLVNVKPARLGGTDETVATVLAARDLGWGCFVGGMLESGIGRAAALAIAASELCVVPTDLGPSDRYVEHDVTAPVTVDDEGRVVIPTGPGIGVDVDLARVDDVTVDRLDLDAA